MAVKFSTLLVIFIIIAADAIKMQESVLERFKRYVQIDTQSKYDCEQVPSTDKQFNLARLLVDELKTLGCTDAVVDEHCYVTATVPASAPSDKVIAMLAHLDTSPDAPGANVRPVVHENYAGGDIVLTEGTTIPASDLAPYVGQDIITSDGTTLLGSDDKAGVAAIMTAVEAWMKRPEENPHGTVRICFTPDEEVGRGTDKLDVTRLGADFGYTVDGGAIGELSWENFNAHSAVVSIRGIGVHPGEAYGVMVNALRIAGDFISMLPKDAAPETTQGKEGFIHPIAFEGGSETATVKLILRSFSPEGIREEADIVETIAAKLRTRYPAAEIAVRITESYRNMAEVIREHPEVVAKAREAMRLSGVVPDEAPIRGGTDGARLSFHGLPTPNLFAGGINFHSKREFVPVPSLNKAAEVVTRLAALYCTDATPPQEEL